ncbi:hypothetical protein EHS25_004741 [Saitozyma podzolica]|uniref:Uncharacterized protein n=1 Tax=Saitozyma podzolica TaxID=1890683 RepID=A0A427Y301_9TREE|nr:hypothetical protein EHS25_004741 [Saitozyma podzolica]
MSSSRRHIPYVRLHKAIIREICLPQKDALLIMAKGLGCGGREDLVLVVRDIQPVAAELTNTPSAIVIWTVDPSDVLLNIQNWSPPVCSLAPESRIHLFDRARGRLASRM